MQSTSGSGSNTNSKSSTSAPLDFSRIKASYKPGSTPYDSTLPPNYSELLPKAMVEAFKAAKFEWGKVPEWVPPLDVR
ncbi:hypothetical protein NLJ89_g7419 [Agrocybe chaxingu]|uniref:Uncharacterized protein n=1 Tax=Agrocybe chaxingu TaxID=84603 RepID=A0A9W8K4I5_9AGAR|nr:hypothetical protein NLJ89_g7419 [Agrocybe chaxingu]